MSQSQQIPVAGGAIACPSSEQLLAFASGVADEATSASIAQHIADCQSCEQAFRSIDSSADPLTSRMRLALQTSAELDDSECFRMIQAAVEMGATRGPLAADDALPATHSLAGTPDDVSDATRYQSLPTASWTPLPIGESIGRYRLETLLGEGTFGRVYLAHDTQLDRPVALKVAKSQELGGANLLAAFLSEARSAARLRHPGIVSIYDVGSEGDFHFIAMEHVPGESLRKQLVGTPQPPARVADLIAQAAEAMHFAHKQGLMHRDLKPANLLLDADGRVRIADFGLALHEDQQRRRAGDRAGTLPYMSPEQVRGDAHRLDGRADIWSLGVIMYELLAGRRPFLGRPREVEDEILHRPPKPLRQIRDDVDQELEQICLKCLAKDPEQRYSSAMDLAEALKGWSSGHPAAKRSKLRPWLSIIVILLAALAVAPLIWIRMRPEMPYPVDKWARPFEWLPVMTQPPEVIDTQISGEQPWSYDSRRRRIKMDTQTVNLLGLGKTESNRFKLQVALSKNINAGTAGIFLGAQSLGTAADGRRGWRCQVITVEFLSGRYFVRRERWELMEVRPNGAWARTRSRTLAYQVVEEEKLGNDLLLEVTVKEDTVDEVLWQNRRLKDLTDPQKLADKSLPGGVGRFGIVNSGGSTTFSGANFMSLRSNPND
jgi:serine/threonine protein kinase